MKKISQLLVITLLSAAGATAQYKKASFLQKDGRIYDVAGAMRILNGGRSSTPGILIGYGREFPGKRLHYWSEFEFITGTKYTYKSISSGTPVVVNGKSQSSLNFRLNLACYILENKDENKLMPFLNLMAGYVFAGGGSDGADFTITPDNVGYPDDAPGGADNGTIFFGGGGGLVYRITNVINLRANAGYCSVAGGINREAGRFHTLVKHPYVNLGIRFRIIRNEE